MREQKQVDTYGYVRLFRVDGCEGDISAIAGISHDSDTGPSIENLIKWGHYSPFEFAGMVFIIHCPIFVARQLMRYRTASYLERSLRYCNAEETEFYYVGEDLYRSSCNMSKSVYNSLVASGVPKEKARGVLPMSTYTTFAMRIDARNLLHILEERTSMYAQAETRAYALVMLEYFQEYFPHIATVLDNFGKAEK